MRGKPLRTWNKHAALLAIFALLGVVFIALSTRWGAGTSPDATGYVSIARNLLSGQGYQDLYGSNAAIWPPFYPLLLVFVGLFGPAPLVTARWINVALFGANILLVGLVLRRYARSLWIPILGSFLVLTCVDLLEIHSMAWTEPLFIFLSLLGLLFIAEYAERQSRSLLLASAAAIALATFTRYAGLSLVATGVTVVLFFTRQRATKKLTDSLLFGVTACLPLILWFVRNAYVTGATAGRTPAFHSISPHRLLRGVKVVSLWLLPERVPLTDVRMPLTIMFIAIVATLVAIFLIALFVARRPEPPDARASKRPLPKLPLVMGTFLAAYIAMLVLTICFSDKFMNLNARRMAPAFAPALILTLCLADRLLRQLKHMLKVRIACAIVLGLTDRLLSAPRSLRRAGVVLAVLTSLLAFWYANRAFWWVSWAREHGLGYRFDRWRESPTIELVRQLDDDVPVFSNAVHVLHLYTGRLTTEVPSRYFYRSGKLNEHIAAQLEQIAEQMAGADGVIAYLDRGKGGSHVTREELEAAIPLRVRHETADGVILELNQ